MNREPRPLVSLQDSDNVRKDVVEGGVRRVLVLDVAVLQAEGIGGVVRVDAEVVTAEDEVHIALAEALYGVVHGFLGSGGCNLQVEIHHFNPVLLKTGGHI